MNVDRKGRNAKPGISSAWILTLNNPRGSGFLYNRSETND